MPNRFCNSPEHSNDFGDTKVAPIDSGASRRSFLKTLAVAGASAALPWSELLEQTTSGVSRIVPGRIDVHHHMFPPESLGGLLHSLLRVDLFGLVLIFAVTMYVRQAINRSTRTILRALANSRNR